MYSSLSVKVLSVVIIANLSLHTQTKTNLDVFKVLVDSSIADLLINSPGSQKNIYVDLKLDSSYTIFENQIYKSVQTRKRSISPVFNPSENSKVSYSIENSAVNYGEVFRDGFLGGHFVERKIAISGSYRFQNEEMIVKDFSFENTDTVKFDDIQTLENSSYPFTKGNIPTEPFLSNLFEPIVAITTAAVVIALFFTVRSK
jgi:hypothetical protein